MSVQPPQVPPSYYSLPAPPERPSVSVRVYKAIIAGLIVVILILSVILVGSGHLPSLGGYRYQLTNAPNAQSILPGPAFTSQSPQYTIWNACGASQASGCSMSSNGWREGSVPDTFDYYVAFTSTVNVTVYFFTIGQFVQFSVCNGDINCVSGSYDSIPASTSRPMTVFTLGEGCADYLAIYVAAGIGTLFPNVGVSPHAAGAATGYCSQAGT